MTPRAVPAIVLALALAGSGAAAPAWATPPPGDVGRTAGTDPVGAVAPVGDPMPASAAIGAGAVALDPANFRLQAGPYSDLIDDLEIHLPVVDVPTVVADSNRVTSACTANAANLVASFCWDVADDIAPYWFPQGITTSADADASGSWQGATAILVSWYDNGSDGVNRGIRVSFIDYSRPTAPAYRHVLLVEPYRRTDGRASFRPIDIHAGGILWYGHHLYVADTDAGLRVFDLRHIWRTATSDNRAVGWQPDGTYQAFGYTYALPQAFTYTQSTVGGQAELTFSFTALDRTSAPPSVVVGEFDYFGGGTRLVRYPIDPVSRMLVADGDGYVRATQAHDVSVARMQGATSINGRYVISISDSILGRGELATFRPGAAVTKYANVLPPGPEDLSYWAARDQLWSLTELPGSRAVFAVRASTY